MPVSIKIYRWAGSFGPFKVKIPCGECALTLDIVKDTLKHELESIEVEIEIKDWLSYWWQPLRLGAWHAPIVIVNDQVVSQGQALNRGLLTQFVIENSVQNKKIEGTHIFGKETCPHCKRAKGYLLEKDIEYTYHDVVKSPRALYEMLGRVKPIVGPKTPITVPQIWINGEYIGGADELSKLLQLDISPNPDRGQCSLSPKR